MTRNAAPVDRAFRLALGSTIRLLRQTKNMSQEKLAEKIDIGQAYLSRVESGTIELSVTRLRQIAKVLDTTADEILRLAEYAREIGGRDLEPAKPRRDLRPRPRR